MKKYYLLALVPPLLPFINLWLEDDGNLSTAQHPPQFKQQDAIISEDTKQQILAHNLWDKARGRIIDQNPQRANPQQQQVASALAQWQLKGVKMPDIAILQTADHLKIYHPGELLPDGARLQKVLIDGIILKRENKTENVYLFGKRS
ncbi:MAG: hypothetical protein Q7U57_11690 [Methylovulum sp.]|nr:hypothetical protein [Methylovulum sp.]